MLRLSKANKLCSHTKIEKLFAEGQSFVQFPLRVVYRIHDKQQADDKPQFFVNIPKKKFKKAVKRVWLRRRVREAFRLNQNLLPLDNTKTIDMAFLYISPEKTEFAVIKRKMADILNRLAVSLTKESSRPNDSKP